MQAEAVFSEQPRELGPLGGDGPLVLTESSFKDYFARTAEAWEGITYMKSRAVAGDAQRAELFLHQLQELDWKRYGQGGRSRADLRQMRMKIEKEQGAAHPFKAGRGDPIRPGAKSWGEAPNSAGEDDAMC